MVAKWPCGDAEGGVAVEWRWSGALFADGGGEGGGVALWGRSIGAWVGVRVRVGGEGEGWGVRVGGEGWGWGQQRQRHRVQDVKGTVNVDHALVLARRAPSGELAQPPR
eukprot:5765003-Prymnesium_polylepis.2